ncbi:MAG: hypothetical protein AB1349_09570 [Elusimicrobiota bacterium]
MLQNATVREFSFDSRKWLLRIIGGLIISFLAVSVYANVPKAILSNPAEGENVVSTHTIVLQVSRYNIPTTVSYYYRKQGVSDWTSIVSTSCSNEYWQYDTVSAQSVWMSSFTYIWHVNLDNDTVYELKAVASNSDGTDPSPQISWFKVERNPVASFGLYTATTPWTAVTSYNGIYYVKATIPLWIRVDFSYTSNRASYDVPNNPTMENAITPTVSITPLNKSAITPVSDSWPSSTRYICKTSIDTNTGDGEATIKITGAKDNKNDTMENFNGSFIIDTVSPSVIKVEVDEDGNGSFTDNNGYVANGEQPSIYVTFNERIYTSPAGFAYFTPSGMSTVQLNWGSFVAGTDQTICYFTAPSAISNTTGDGPASFELKYSTDIAGNVISPYTQSDLFNIDGTAPQAPVISTPVAGAAFDPGSIITVTLQDPTDADISFASFTAAGGNYYADYTPPYQAALLLPEGFNGEIRTQYFDKAGNKSTSQTVTVSINPAIDKTAPLARVTAIGGTFPNVTLTASVNTTNTNVEKVVFEYSTGKTNWITIGTDANNADDFNDVVWDVSSLSSGNYYLRATATDLNGNTDTSPSIVDVYLSKEAGNVTITGSAAKADTTYNVSATLDTTNKKVDIVITSTNTPTVTVELYDVATSSYEWILPSQITVGGSEGNYTASVSSDFITDNTRGRVIVTAKNANGEVMQRQCIFGAVKIDAAKGANLDCDIPYGVDVNIPANAIKSNTSLIMKPVETPASTQEGIIPFGQTYDFSFLDGTKNFAPITLTFNYPTTVNNLFVGSTAEQTKLTVCYYDGSKWTRDKNVEHNNATATSIDVKTNHFTKFSIVADYAKPKISSVKVNGAVVTFKGTDEGVGISTGNSYLRVNGNNYSPAYNSDTDDLVVDAELTDAGDYPYILHLQDNVGNYTELSGVISYTTTLEIGDAHNYPNPFDPDKEDTIIRFTISEDSRITIKIYDFNGDLVSVVTRNEAWGSWVKETRWGGTNDNGKKVANGTYFCEIIASGSQDNVGRTVREVIKIVVLRRK